MPRLVIGMIDNKGFTLIEIMVVIVIIGITIGFALIAFGDFGASKRIFFAADQLRSTIRLAQQQAILENSTLGLKIDNTSYQFFNLKNNASWSPMPNRGVFKMTYFPNNTWVKLQVASPISTKAPSIILNSSGDMTPFTLNFGSNEKNTIAILKGMRNGELQLNATGDQ